MSDTMACAHCLEVLVVAQQGSRIECVEGQTVDAERDPVKAWWHYTEHGDQPKTAAGYTLPMEAVTTVNGTALCISHAAVEVMTTKKAHGWMR
jgi:hypothetical protein